MCRRQATAVEAEATAVQRLADSTRFRENARADCRFELSRQSACKTFDDLPEVLAAAGVQPLGSQPSGAPLESDALLHTLLASCRDVGHILR